ncbi:MAG: HAMP domain-containing histidine kinase [Variovorax sp.]|jgi:signal transduction histidine kinase|uniref:histidine kinase n=1 Tax=Variovorax paradoxus TaxID=34073 RepID=A0A2W5QT92_VARPD|nr:HAMP domain-containing histidine kinase [Variovorax sp.]PZQ78165.1 MAG: sensor histidine kinase [Variovorax paradoxus]
MKAGSLRWRLVRNLVMLQVAAGVLVLVGVIALYWAVGRFVDEGGERTAETVGAALGHSPRGQLVMRDGEEIRWLLKASPQLWFIARDAHGHELRYGDVPERYAEVIHALDGVARASLDLADASARPAARFEKIETAKGPINLVVKTGSPFSMTNKLKWWTLAFLVLVAPTMLVTCLVVVIATPFVIRRGLRGVVATAAQAENVNIDTLATRLPVHGVPLEILSLVEAVNRAFDRLDEGYRRQARFLADAAHELRTPITTLRIQADSLPDTAHKAPLVRATTRLMTLAEQLLDLQRLQHSTVPSQQVDLREICERVPADLAPLAVMSGCSIAVEAPQPVFLHADAFAIERAVGNLVQNAIEHGGRRAEIQVLVQPPGTIVVNDSGPGIPIVERARVLDPFHRIHPRGRGAGLGLHLVSEVARMHRGRLVVGESPRGGASMLLVLEQCPDSTE